VVAATTVSAYQVNATDDFNVAGTLNLGGGASTFASGAPVTVAERYVNTGAVAVTFNDAVTTQSGSNFNVTV
jgi:hypothetical protein